MLPRLSAAGKVGEDSEHDANVHATVWQERSRYVANRPPSRQHLRVPPYLLGESVLVSGSGSVRQCRHGSLPPVIRWPGGCCHRC